MLLQQLLEKIMRKKKFSKLVSSCQYYCLLGTVHTTSSAGGFDSEIRFQPDVYRAENTVFADGCCVWRDLRLFHRRLG